LSHHAGAVQIKIEVDLVGEVVVVASNSGGGEEVLDDALRGFFCCGSGLVGV
jgi:hypothetical protein